VTSNSEVVMNAVVSLQQFIKYILCGLFRKCYCLSIVVRVASLGTQPGHLCSSNIGDCAV